MKIGIYGQFYHAHSEDYIQPIIGALEAGGAKVLIERQFLNLIGQHPALGQLVDKYPIFDKLDDSFDLFVSIGGDGTLLKAVTFVGDLGIPIVGINTGRLGFLATFQKEHISESIAAIFKGNYELSERSLLQLSTNAAQDPIGPMNYALNEIAVNRNNTTSMIRVETEINGEYLSTYFSDGLIVATPTGSTGYSLSCGGPVIDPSTNSLVVTPIAPHNLNARPLVIPDNCTLTLKVSGREATYLVSLDSRIATLHNDMVLTIRKAPFTIKLVQLTTDSFVKTLRKKLLWGEDKRN